MDAPTYPPATTFVQPLRLPITYSTSDTPIATLQANPDAWSIVVSEIPNISARIGNPQLKPHLGNFSLRSLVQFGIMPTDALDRIDPKLKALGGAK